MTTATITLDQRLHEASDLVMKIERYVIEKREIDVQLAKLPSWRILKRTRLERLSASMDTAMEKVFKDLETVSLGLEAEYHRGM